MSILPLNHATALSLLKAWFHSYMLAYAQSARSDKINLNQKDYNFVVTTNYILVRKKKKKTGPT